MKQLILLALLAIPFMSYRPAAEKAILFSPPEQTKFDSPTPHCVYTVYDRWASQLMAPILSRTKGRVTHAQFEGARRKAKKRFTNKPVLLFPNALAEVLKRIDMFEQTGMIVQ